MAGDSDLQKLLAPGAKVEKLAGGMQFVEGPVWAGGDGGHLVFSDIPASELKLWDPKIGLTTFRTDTNNTNGNTRDLQGRLTSCEQSARRVTRTDVDGKLRFVLRQCTPPSKVAHRLFSRPA